MSNNQGDAATTARDPETEQTQTSGTRRNTQVEQPPAFEQQTGNTPEPSGERQAELDLRPGTHHQTENTPTAGTPATENAQDNEPHAQTGQATTAESQPQAADHQAQAE